LRPAGTCWTSAPEQDGLLNSSQISAHTQEFSDYVVPNAALDAGELQANSFQNQPYLDNQKADRGYKIESVGLTVNFPIGVYSKKHKSWSDIPRCACE
jgi:ABC-type metal ion transport system substrate-binding protein